MSFILANLKTILSLVVATILSFAIWWYIFHLPSLVREYRQKEHRDTVILMYKKKVLEERLKDVETNSDCDSNCTISL